MREGPRPEQRAAAARQGVEPGTASAASSQNLGLITCSHRTTQKLAHLGELGGWHSDSPGSPPPSRSTQWRFHAAGCPAEASQLLGLVFMVTRRAASRNTPLLSLFSILYAVASKSPLLCVTSAPPLRAVAGTAARPSGPARCRQATARLQQVDCGSSESRKRAGLKLQRSVSVGRRAGAKELCRPGC